MEPKVNAGTNIDPEPAKRPKTASFLNVGSAAPAAAILFLFLVSLIPLYGIKYPINVDLPEHLIVSKLFLEKITGISQLEIEVSTFLGYRLSPVFLAAVFATVNMIGISPLHVPQITLVLLILLHAFVVAAILRSSLGRSAALSYTALFVFSLPAVAAMYSASWFIGFVGYTMATTCLIPAIFFTERFLSDGKAVNTILIFVSLALVYMAHPFVLIFWLMWCGCRLIASAVNLAFLAEWKRLLMLALPFAPIFLYNAWATSGTELKLIDRPLFNISPFVSPAFWYETRIKDLLAGTMFKADLQTSGWIFAVAAIILIAGSAAAAYLRPKDLLARNIALASLLLLIISTWINEEFIPRPVALWIAWDHRYTTTVFTVCLAVAGVIMLRHRPRWSDRSLRGLASLVLAAVAVIGGVSHIFETRKAYARFDEPARLFMERALNNEDTVGIRLPGTSWHPDGTLIRLYSCLLEPDCNPDGTMFKSLGGNIWAVKVRSSKANRPPAKPQPPTGEKVNAFRGGEGSAPGQFRRPRGLAVDDKGNIYVADSGNARVQKFDPEGNFIFAIGSRGTAAGELMDPNGVAVDGLGNVYVVDAANRALLKFSSDGNFIRQWKGVLPGLYGPRDIAASPNGRLYIVDQGNGRIVRFDVATEAFISWGSLGDGQGQFSEPTGIAVGDGEVFVADLGNDRVQVFDLDGAFLREWPVPAWGKYVWHYPDLVYDDAARIVYLTNGWRNQLLAFDPNGGPADGEVPSEVESTLGNPSSIVIAGAGKKRRLLILNTASAKLSSFDLQAKGRK